MDVGPVLDLVVGVLTVLLVPEISRERIERHTEAVADAIGEDLLDVRPDLAADGRARGEEGVVARHRAVVVEPEDHARKVRIVGLGSAELVVGNGGAQTGLRRSRGKVLKLAAPPGVANMA